MTMIYAEDSPANSKNSHGSQDRIEQALVLMRDLRISASRAAIRVGCPSVRLLIQRGVARGICRRDGMPV